MLGVVHRAVVQLDDAVFDELAICEGVETGIAARILGITPVWALGSCGAIAHFPVLPGIRTLNIIAERDQASADGVELGGTRYHRAGRCVHIIEPPLGRNDLNDALGAHAYDGVV
jgi:Toprim domain